MSATTARMIARTLAVATSVTAGILLTGCSLLLPPTDLHHGGESSGSSSSRPSDDSTSDDATEDDSDAASPPSTDAQNTDVFTIAVGDCLNDTTGTVSEVPQVDCAVPHDFEVYYDFEVDGDGAYPGEDAITAEADSGCETAFPDFVGIDYESSALDYSYYYPTEESWTDAADRLISCIITDPDVQTTGSLAGAAR
jgi:hypothetical protein